MLNWKQVSVFFLFVCLVISAIIFIPRINSKDDSLHITFNNTYDRVEVGTELEAHMIIASTSTTRILYPDVATATPGTKNLLYIAQSSDGKTQKEFLKSIEVLDPTPPILELSTSIVTIMVDEAFDPQSFIVTAHDDYDGDLFADISGNYDLSVPGTYILTYTITDTSNNTATTTLDLVVTLPKQEPPQIPDTPAKEPEKPSNGEIPPQSTKPSTDAPTPSPNLPKVVKTFMFDENSSYKDKLAECTKEGVNLNINATCEPIYDNKGVLVIGYQLVKK